MGMGKLILKLGLKIYIEDLVLKMPIWISRENDILIFPFLYCLNYCI